MTKATSKLSPFKVLAKSVCGFQNFPPDTKRSAKWYRLTATS